MSPGRSFHPSRFVNPPRAGVGCNAVIEYRRCPPAGVSPTCLPCAVTGCMNSDATRSRHPGASASRKRQGNRGKPILPQIEPEEPCAESTLRRASAPPGTGQADGANGELAWTGRSEEWQDRRLRKESALDRRTIHQITGLAGLAGAILFFCGDMLLYGHFGSAAEFSANARLTILGASTERLVAGGLIGVVAAAMCIPGYWHVLQNVHAGSRPLGWVMFLAFFLFSVAGGSFHSLTTETELIQRHCADQLPRCAELIRSSRVYAGLLYAFAATPGFLAAFLLLYLVAAGKTTYPRWMVLANPGLLMLLLSSPIADALPGPMGAAIVGGDVNVSLAIFFLLSIATTWQRKIPAIPVASTT